MYLFLIETGKEPAPFQIQFRVSTKKPLHLFSLIEELKGNDLGT